MTFPTVASQNNSNNTGAPTSHTVALPSGIVAGNLLIAIIICHAGASFTWPTGWTELYDQSWFDGFSTAYRVADGSEGASITVTSSVGGESAHMSCRITGADTGTAPHVSGPAASADPPNSTPSWGTEDTLWIPTFHGVFGSNTLSGYPTSYTNGNNQVSSGGSASLVAWAFRQLNASSENPGAFNTTFSGYSWTIAVKPAVAGGKPKIWTGSAWVEKPLKVWNGSTWVEKPVKVWNGSSWVLA